MRKGSLHISVRLVFLAAGLLTAAGVLASCPVDVLPFSAGAGTQVSPCPGVNYAYGRMVYIIRGADIAVTGLPGGTPVTGIGWGFMASYAPQWPATAPLKIYLQNTNDYTNMKSTDWATAVSTMTLVHNATTTMPDGAGVFQIPFTGGASFTYTGGGLYVAFDWGQYTGTLDATVATMSTSASHQPGDSACAYSNTAPPTTLSASLDRLELDPSVPGILRRDRAARARHVGDDQVDEQRAQPVALFRPLDRLAAGRAGRLGSQP